MIFKMLNTLWRQPTIPKEHILQALLRISNLSPISFWSIPGRINLLSRQPGMPITPIFIPSIDNLNILRIFLIIFLFQFRRVNEIEVVLSMLCYLRRATDIWKQKLIIKRKLFSFQIVFSQVTDDQARISILALTWLKQAYRVFELINPLLAREGFLTSLPFLKWTLVALNKISTLSIWETKLGFSNCHHRWRAGILIFTRGLAVSGAWLVLGILKLII